ncbi:hypothetical protein KUCAC02_025145 [Chaenocephalus aceratus]|nr:hypothetical protein KUCAC02_025145 [Chaenocephalus aceratus]
MHPGTVRLHQVPPPANVKLVAKEMSASDLDRSDTSATNTVPVRSIGKRPLAAEEASGGERDLRSATAPGPVMSAKMRKPVASKRDRAPSDTSATDAVPVTYTGKRTLGTEDVSGRELDRGSAAARVKSAKKRRLVASERDRAPSNPTEPHVFSFPGLTIVLYLVVFLVLVFLSQGMLE